MNIKYIGKLIQDATKGFEIGDNCWVVEYEWESEQCDLCNGNPLIFPINDIDTEVICPKCKGKGNISKMVLGVKKRKIEDMFLTILAKPDKYDITVRADVGDTGMRTSVDNLFETKEEAQKDANRRNMENSRMI